MKRVFKVNLRGSHWGNSPIIGDSIIAMLNTFDMQIYALGKGPSATAVTAPNTAITLGSSIVISGKVTDISPGTEAYARTARFPNGVAVVSDESMSEWMEYVYLQSERPTDIIGVPVTLSVIDSNGNFRNIGTATSDADGFFSYAWQPDIEGKYTIIATFAGSKAFYGSHAEAAFVVDPSPATPTPQPEQPPTLADQYILPGIIGIIVAIAIGFAVTILVLKKKP